MKATLSEEQSRTFTEKFRDHNCRDDYQYLYIINEQGEKNCCKIGITSSKLWERLRKLQQGNPRKLEIKHLYAGRWFSIADVEATLKKKLSHYRSDGGTEWLEMSAEDLSDHIQKCLPKDVMKITKNKWLYPYTSTSYGSCSLHWRKFSPRDLLMYEWEIIDK